MKTASGRQGRTISAQQTELIDAVIAEKATGGLSAAILEKDIHVTDALHALFSIRFEHIDFAFCGADCI
jgi:hypothetical protein